MVFFVFFSAMAELSPIPLAAAFVSFSFLYFLAIRVESERIRESRHIPFIPVPLLPFKAKTFSLFPLLLPFGLASVLALFVPLFLPNLFPPRQQESPIDLHYLISPGDYYRHIDFQMSFSYRRLDQNLYADSTPGQWALNQEAFLLYYLGEDGLIAGSTGHSSAPWIIPPFPLEKLMDFLLNYDKVPALNSRFAAPGTSLFTSIFMLREWIAVAIILAAWIFDLLPPAIRPGIRPLLRSKKKEKIPVSGNKWISAWNLNQLRRSGRRFPS
jgi:hypothetical protein